MRLNEMLKIVIDDVENLIYGLERSKDRIDVKVTEINDPTQNQEIMLSEYVKKIREISNLLEKYVQLLEEDISDIKASKEKIKEADKVIKVIVDGVTTVREKVVKQKINNVGSNVGTIGERIVKETMKTATSSVGAMVERSNK